MAKVFLSGKQLNLPPSALIGSGGEADIFDIGGGQVLKLFKGPTHPDVKGNPLEEKNARDRLAQHQTKLKDFPKGLPSRVVAPKELAYDSNKKIVGYSMTFLSGLEVLLRLTDQQFQASLPGAANVVPSLFADLHETVDGLHHSRVVIGDFNDLNILFDTKHTYLIDADSFQFGRYACAMFTAKFADPLLCDPARTSPFLVKPHNDNSDWYAYAVMLFQSLLFVDPYGGIYRPSDSKKRLAHAARSLHRITVFNPEVKYPKPARPYDTLPDKLLDQFHRIFEKDERGLFPYDLVQSLRATTCTNCGREHFRDTCPWCQTRGPAVTKLTEVRGTVTAHHLVSRKANRLVLFAAVQDGRLAYLIHENDIFSREDGTVVAHGAIDPWVKYRIRGSETLFAKGNRLVRFVPNKSSQIINVDEYRNLPVFDANSRNIYWVEEGQLRYDNVYSGSEYIGDVLNHQTLFWMGPSFGFGFYRASELRVAFVFKGAQRGIRDSVKLSILSGQLLDATAYFTSSLCWLFIQVKDGATINNRCQVFNDKGESLASAEAQDGDGSWLGTIRGKCPVGNFLFAPTDDGLQRIEIANGYLEVTRKFSNTESFINSGSKLYADNRGLYVVGSHTITHLQMTSTS